MAYYCNECAEWISSRDSKMDYHNGRLVVHKWCDYDRKYRAEDQQIYGCGGFSYVRRSVITKICEILNINGEKLFNAFDETKEKYIVPTEFGKLVDYNMVGTEIANGLTLHPQRKTIAKNMLEGFIIPAEAEARVGKYKEAVDIYERMIKVLAIIFNATKEKQEEKAFYDNLIKIR